MKRIITIALIFLCLFAVSQQKKILVQGKVIDQRGNPITDVYIVNLNSHDKDISHVNGVFAIWASSSDSLIFSHISYFRKVVRMHTLLINPEVRLDSEQVDIPEVLVTPDYLTDIERADLNLAFLSDYKAPEFNKIEEEHSPVQTIMVESNELMRSEAASVSLVRFSPSHNVEMLFLKLKKKDHLLDYTSTRKQMKADN